MKRLLALCAVLAVAAFAIFRSLPAGPFGYEDGSE
jgi:hypothetical protein